MARLLALPVGEDEGDESVVLQRGHPPGVTGASPSLRRGKEAFQSTGSICRF
jgi:hypothetical protein